MLLPNINIYQAKACHPCLHKSFLIFNNHLQKVQQPQYFSGKCPRVLILKKLVYSTRTFLLACDVVVVPLHKLFSVIRQTVIILNDKTQFLLFHTHKKTNFQFFLFQGICKSRLYSLDVSTDIPILDSLLVHVY